MANWQLLPSPPLLWSEIFHTRNTIRQLQSLGPFEYKPWRKRDLPGQAKKSLSDYSLPSNCSPHSTSFPRNASVSLRSFGLSFKEEIESRIENTTVPAVSCVSSQNRVSQRYPTSIRSSFSASARSSLVEGFVWKSRNELRKYIAHNACRLGLGVYVFTTEISQAADHA